MQHALARLPHPTGQVTFLETHTGPARPHGQAKSRDGQVLKPNTLDVPAWPHSPEDYHVATRPVLGGGKGCLEGQVRQNDGSFVMPEETRSMYVVGVPETPRTSARPSPRLPSP